MNGLMAQCGADDHEPMRVEDSHPTHKCKLLCVCVPYDNIEFDQCSYWKKQVCHQVIIIKT